MTAHWCVAHIRLHLQDIINSQSETKFSAHQAMCSLCTHAVAIFPFCGFVSQNGDYGSLDLYAWLFYLASYSRGWFMVYHELVIHFYSFCVYTHIHTQYLVHPLFLDEFWVVPTFCVLWLKLWRTSLHRYMRDWLFNISVCIIQNGISMSFDDLISDF